MANLSLLPADAGAKLHGKSQEAILFGVMLAIAAGNTGLQSVVPPIGRNLHIPDPFIALTFPYLISTAALLGLLIYGLDQRRLPEAAA